MASGSIDVLHSISTDSYQNGTINITRIGKLRIVYIQGRYDSFSARDTSFLIPTGDRPSVNKTAPCSVMNGTVYTKTGHVHIYSTGQIYAEGFNTYNSSTYGQVQLAAADTITGTNIIYTI